MACGFCMAPVSRANAIVESVPTTVSVKAQRALKIKRLAHKKRLTKSDVRYVVRWSANQRHLTKKQEQWAERAAIDIIFTGACESHGNAKARNGQYRGIMQMGNSWGTEKRRMNPVTSIDWFVRTYDQGGKRKIRQHWRATLGR